MKLLFTDIDGVLNRMDPYYHKDGYLRPLIEPDCVVMLNRIIDFTDAKIVVSSSWRNLIIGGSMDLHGFDYMLGTHGVRRGVVIGHTGTSKNENRADEISECLASFDNVDGYVVLDDKHYVCMDRHPFVHVNGTYGLRRGDVIQAVKLLGVLPGMEAEFKKWVAAT